jgi:multisubunit Na+/H+ antiporter MnhF subunit
MNVFEMISFFLLVFSLALGMVRLLRGPTLPDRVVAADTLAVITTAGLVWLASKFNNAVYLDIALVYGILSFIGVVAMARVLESHVITKK